MLDTQQHNSHASPIVTCRAPQTNRSAAFKRTASISVSPFNQFLRSGNASPQIRSRLGSTFSATSVDVSYTDNHVPTDGDTSSEVLRIGTTRLLPDRKRSLRHRQQTGIYRERNRSERDIQKFSAGSAHTRVGQSHIRLFFLLAASTASVKGTFRVFLSMQVDKQALRTPTHTARSVVHVTAWVPLKRAPVPRGGGQSSSRQRSLGADAKPWGPKR